MKIKSVRIQKLRSFDDELIYFNDYTCLVGPNGSGKSTVLCALNIFFREAGHSATDLTCLTEEDFHQRDTSHPIAITVTFGELSSEAQTDFAAYCRHGELVVSAVAEFDPVTKSAHVKQFGQRRGMAAFKPFFGAEVEGKPVAALKEEYGHLRETFPDLPAAPTKLAMTEALRSYEDSHPDLCELIPSSDQFYGFTKGANLLAKYVQWVFVPAVKDASTEQSEAKDTALARLLARTVRSKSNIGEEFKALQERTQSEYRALLEKSQGTLGEISSSLESRLINWSHPDASLRLEWRHDPGRSVRVDEPLAEIVAGEGQFFGNLARFGHGLQRSYLLALLQELSGCDDASGPRLILCCEEPELFQHPPQAQYLADVLQKLSTQNCQVVVCTHSPYFVSGECFEDVRLVRKERVAKCSRVASLSIPELARAMSHVTGKTHTRRTAGIAAKIHQALQPALNEMFFTPVLILVEGLEDVAYITSYLHLSGKWDAWRRSGCHMVPAGGKSSMIQPLMVASLMNIPVFAVFDSDDHSPDRNGSKVKHDRDNTVLLRLCGVDKSTLTAGTTYWGKMVVMWDSEMGEVVIKDLPSSEISRIEEAARLRNGQIEGLAKNSLYIADLLDIAWSEGNRLPTLDRLCKAIIEFAEGQNGLNPANSTSF
jgi:energy-coupling factor transporter ATP-binding protein EcfA2